MDNFFSTVQLAPVHSIKVALALRSVTRRKRQSAKIMMHTGHVHKSRQLSLLVALPELFTNSFRTPQLIIGKGNLCVCVHEQGEMCEASHTAQ